MNSYFQKMKAANYYLIFLSSVILLSVNSCKTKKEIIRPSLHTIEKADSELFSDILSKQLVFSSFSSNLNISLSNGKRTLASKAHLKIINDQMLQLSVQPLFGVEIFRFYIDTDTLIILDRMNKRYVKESLKELENHFLAGFNYHTLQSLLTNRLFSETDYITSPTDYTKFAYKKTTTNYYLQSINEETNIEHFFSVNADDRITFCHLLDPINNYSLQWSYSDFARVGSQIFPYNMKIEVSSPKRKLDIEINYSNIVLDEPIELSITIPNNYTQVNFSEIEKIITANNS